MNCRALLTAGIAATTLGCGASSCNTTIAFESERSGTTQIFTMDQDGSNQTQVTSGTGFNTQPALSPGGGRVVYASKASLGSKESLLFTFFLPNGAATAVTTNALWANGGRWSPNNTEIAFSALRTSDLRGPDIMTIWSNGTQAKYLTTGGTNLEPSYSPDGTKVLYTSLQNGHTDVWIMNADGSGKVQLTNSPSTDGYASFNSDGTKIAFWSDRSGNGDIYVMNADGSNQVTVVSDPAPDFHPVFAPYTNEIAFASTRGNNTDIYVVDLSTGAVRRLTTDPAADRAPDWK